MRRAIALVVLAVAMAVVACGSSDDAGPPAITYGRDLCVRCGMIVDDARFATAYRTADGDGKVFDDVGGMVLHLEETGDQPPDQAIWVHDFGTEEWILAVDAHYVPTLSVASPMGHSILAFAEQERAEAFASEVDGAVISWATVLDLPVTDGLVGDHHTGGVDDMGHSGTGHDDDTEGMDQ